MSGQLSPRRLALLLRNDAVGSYRSLLVVSTTLAALIVLNAAIMAYAGGNAFVYRTWFIGTLFVWGTIASSLSFRELHDKTRNTAYLLLPASALEKTIARLLATTIGLPVHLLLLTSVLSIVIEPVNSLAFGVRNEIFQPFDRVAWQVIPHYLVVHSLFFLGAAWFRKTHYVKTLLAIVAGALAFIAVCLWIAWLFGAAGWSGSGLLVQGDFYDAVYLPLEGVFDTGYLLYLFALPPLCWFVAWLRLTETQVSHGV